MDTIISFFHSGFSIVVPFVILLGLLIFVHELGHFLVAKYWKVRVEVFSLGFGKKIFQKKHGDTTYCISLFPLGGYVKMYGDDPSAEISESEKKFSYSHKPVFQRITVVLAGPLMNFFFAIFLFFIIAMTGEQARGPYAGDVEAETQAFAFGFRSGDKFISSDSGQIKTWEDITDRLNQNIGNEISFKVEREGSKSVEEIKAKATLGQNPNILSSQEIVGEIAGLTNSSKASLIGVASNSIAFQAGFRTGDLITSINDNKIKYFREIENYFVSLQGQEINVKVDRIDINDSNKTTSLDIKFKNSNVPSLQSIGIERSELFLAKVIEDSPAAKAGFKSGDKIVSINGATPKRWEDILNAVKSFDEKNPLVFEVQQDSVINKIEIVPRMTSQMNSNGGEEKRFTIGITPWAMPANPEIVNIKSDSVLKAVVRGYDRTIEVTQMTVISFLRIIQAKISPKSIGGVISIGQAATETFKMGLSQFIQMMAVLSVNLFILNLLPVPVLDGGHLLFYCIEAIKGTPLSMRKLEIAQQIGLVMLVSLMVFALFNDFSRLLGR